MITSHVGTPKGGPSSPILRSKGGKGGNVPFTVLLFLPSQGDRGQDGAEVPAEPRARRRPRGPGRGDQQAAHLGGDHVPAAELGGGGDAGAAQLAEGVPGEPG